MRQILSAVDTYNYKLTRWLDEKLKPLYVNDYIVNDAFRFAQEIRNHEINEGEILISYDVVSLFTNVPLNETIDILVNKAFIDDWFNRTHNLNVQKEDLRKLQ